MTEKDTQGVQDIANGQLVLQPKTTGEISGEVVIPLAEIVQSKGPRRKIDPVYAIAYVSGILIGSGIFISTSLIVRQTSNVGTALIMRIITAIPCIWGAFCPCERTCMSRKTRGTYLYTYLKHMVNVQPL